MPLFGRRAAVAVADEQRAIHGRARGRPSSLILLFLASSCRRPPAELEVMVRRMEAAGLPLERPSGQQIKLGSQRRAIAAAIFRGAPLRLSRAGSVPGRATAALGTIAIAIATEATATATATPAPSSGLGSTKWPVISGLRCERPCSRRSRQSFGWSLSSPSSLLLLFSPLFPMTTRRAAAESYAEA